MNELEILVSAESLHKGDRSITGQCAIRAGGDAFPEPAWSDFVVVVLGWWLRAFAAAEGASEPVELFFMDGPFLVRVEPINGSLARLQFVKQRVSGEAVSEATVSLRQALEACLTAASTVLDACNVRRWGGTDIEELMELVGTARSV